MSWLRAVWAFLRELSGEAALARRMAHGLAHGVSAREAYVEAVTEAFEGARRCC